MSKSTVEEIKQRFDKDVERFANVDTGQVSTIDASLSLELITEAAKRIVPGATHVLDIGCGAGNFTIKMLSKVSNLACTLVDLSRPMLDKALERVKAHTDKEVSRSEEHTSELQSCPHLVCRLLLEKKKKKK